VESDSKLATGSAAAAWDEVATSYDEARRTDPVYSACVHHVTGNVPKGTAYCLDAGCGTGLATALLSDRCQAVVALDFSLNSLRVLKRKGLRNVVAVQANLARLPFKDDVFDACVCANTLQHIQPRGPQGRVIAELKRVTKEDGKLSVSVHHYSKAKRKQGWVKEGRPGQAGVDYIFRFSRNDLQAVIPGARITGVGYYGLMRIPWFGSRLQNLSGRAMGSIAALLGFGHMLIADVKNRREAVPVDGR
jgi:SAM-dependent methyltransferase